MFNLKYGKIIIIVILAILSVFFLFYFLNLSASIQFDVEEIVVNGAKEKQEISKDLDIDFKLFEKNKFKKLKAVNVPAESFNIGKRDPFEKD